MTADGKQQQVGKTVCDGCGDLDPRSSESAPAFYNVTTSGRKQYIHQLPRHLRMHCLQHGYTNCKVIGIVLRLQGELDRGDDRDLV